MDGQDLQNSATYAPDGPGLSHRLGNGNGHRRPLATAYVWTSREGRTPDGRQWSPGAEHRTRGGDEVYGGVGWLYAFASVELAETFAILSGEGAAVLWRCEAEVRVDWQDRLGCTWLKAIEPVARIALIDDDFRIRVAGRVLRHALALSRERIVEAEEQLEQAERAYRWSLRWRWLFHTTLGWAVLTGTRRAGLLLGPQPGPSESDAAAEREMAEKLTEARARLASDRRRMLDIKGELYEHLTDFGNMSGVSAAQRIAWAAEKAREMGADLGLPRHLRAVLGA